MTEMAKRYAEYLDLPQQEENESDYDFRARISGVLREQGKLIESHEVFHNSRYDDPDKSDIVQTGIMGALDFIMQGQGFQRNPLHPEDGHAQIGDDIMLGLLKHPPKEKKKRRKEKRNEMEVWGMRNE